MRNLFLVFIMTFILMIFNTTLIAQNNPCSLQTDANGDTQWVNNETGAPCPFSILTQVPFQKINPDARSAGMGDVGIATPGAENAMIFNFSKIAFSDKKIGLAANYTSYPKRNSIDRTFNYHDLYLNSFYKLKDKNTLGIGIRMLNINSSIVSDSIPRMDIINSSRKATDAYLNLAYARKFNDHFSASIGLKYIYSNLDRLVTDDDLDLFNTGHSYAFDFGISYKNDISLFKKKSNLSIGLSITDAGKKIGYVDDYKGFLPTKLGIGTALKMHLKDQHTLTIASDATKLLVPTPTSFTSTNDIGEIEGMIQSFSDAPGGLSEELSEIMYSFGAEYMFKERFALRAGYFTEDKFKGGRKYFTLGAGITHDIFTWNIAYSKSTLSSGDQINNNTLRFSMLVNLGFAKKDSEVN